MPVRKPLPTSLPLPSQRSLAISPHRPPQNTECILPPPTSMPFAALAGVDTLEVGYAIKLDGFKLDQAEFDNLAGAKKHAQSMGFNSPGAPVTVGGMRFNIAPTGRSGYAYVLSNKDVIVRLAAEARGGTLFPEVHVKFISDFLWEEGFGQAQAFMRWWVQERIGDIAYEKLSRLDLCVDVAGPAPEVDPLTNVVGRAKEAHEWDDLKIGTHSSSRARSGWTFGNRPTRCNIYDKRREIAKHHGAKLWFEDLWRGNGWDGQSPVWRVEVQLGRPTLKAFRLETFADVERRLADIWTYFSTGWLKIVEAVPGDPNRSRWPASTWWSVVQQSHVLFGKHEGKLERSEAAPSILTISRARRGYMVSEAAAHAAMLVERTSNWANVTAAASGIRVVAYHVLQELAEPQFALDVIDKMPRFTKARLANEGWFEKAPASLLEGESGPDRWAVVAPRKQDGDNLPPPTPPHNRWFIIEEESRRYQPSNDAEWWRYSDQPKPADDPGAGYFGDITPVTDVMSAGGFDQYDLDAEITQMLERMGVAS